MCSAVGPLKYSKPVYVLLQKENLSVQKKCVEASALARYSALFGLMPRGAKHLWSSGLAQTQFLT